MSETERWVEGERVWLKWVQGGPIASARQPVSQDAGWAEVIPAEQLRGAVDALREIAKADPIDNALDPQRPVRVAKAWLREHDATGGR